MANPLLINVTRDPAPQGGGGEPEIFVESIHRGAIAIVNAAGEALVEVGDVEGGICPRSTLKPLQALAFLESGAIESFDLGPQEIALSAASHNGEPQHVAVLEAWLGKIGCTLGDLECGAHPPMHQDSARDQIVAGAKPDALHNNCSGKHTAFLSLARAMKVDVAGYTAVDHPVQVRVAAAISDMVGMDVTTRRVGADGCAAPNFAMPLKALAYGLARMSAPAGLTSRRGAAVATLLEAVAKYPALIAGTSRACTALIPYIRGGGLVKSGAEGVYGAILPGLWLGIAIKIDDGAGRAAEMVLANVLDRLGALDRGAKEVEDLLFRSITNVRGDVVGSIRPSQNWDGFGFGSRQNQKESKPRS